MCFFTGAPPAGTDPYFAVFLGKIKSSTQPKFVYIFCGDNEGSSNQINIKKSEI